MTFYCQNFGEKPLNKATVRDFIPDNSSKICFHIQNILFTRYQGYVIMYCRANFCARNKSQSAIISFAPFWRRFILMFMRLEFTSISIFSIKQTTVLRYFVNSCCIAMLYCWESGVRIFTEQFPVKYGTVPGT